MIKRATLHNILTCVIATIIFIFQLLNDSISRIKNYVNHEGKSTAAVTADTIISSDSSPNDNNASKNCISVLELIQKRFDVPLINAEDEPKVDTSVHNNNQFSNFDNICGEFMDHLIDDSYVARGLGLITAIVGRQTEFYLYSKYDNNYEHIVIELKGRNGEYGKTTILNQIAAGFTEPKSIPIDYIYDEDRIKVTYTPLAEGVHTLMLSQNGLSICRSPYYVSVEKSPTNSRSRVRLGTKKYKMVTKFGKIKQALSEIKQNNIVPVTIESHDQSEIIKNDNVHSGSDENYITGTDVMSIVTKFESNNIGFKKMLHSRMSSIAEKSPENDLIVENSTLLDEHPKIETLIQNYNTTDNVLDVKNATVKMCSNNVNRENTTQIHQKSLNCVLNDRLKNENSNKIENPDQTTEQLNQKNNKFPIKFPIIDQLKINSNNTNKPDSNPNDFIAQRLITDSTRHNISTPLAACIITKIKNLVCEKCSKRVFNTLSELPNDINSTIQNTNSSERSSNCETVLAQPMKADINTANDVCETTTYAIDKQFDNSPNLEQMDIIDKTITTRHLLNEIEPLNNNSEELYSHVDISMSTDMIFERNKFNCESSQILDKNILDTISISPNKFNIEDINMIRKEYCSITEENASINSNIFNTNIIKNSKDKIELQVQNTQSSHDTDLTESNNCEKNIGNALNCISKENNLSTLDTDRLLLINNNRTTNESLDTDESKLIKSKSVSNENSNVQSCIINKPVLASIKVPCTECKERDHEQQTSDNNSQTTNKNLIFATISDVNQKLIIETLFEPILNNFKNNIVEQIMQLCLHEDLSNTYFTQFLKINTKLINDSCEIQKLKNTEHEDKQIENNKMLITQEENIIDKDKSIKTKSDIKRIDHNRLSEYVKKVIKKDVIPNENCVESMANMKLHKIVNIATHRSGNQQIEFDKNETIDTLIEECIVETPIADNVKPILKDEPKYIKLEKYCNDDNITKDLLVKTPDVVNITTEIITPTEQYLENIKTKDETLLPNDTKTIMVENTNIAKQKTVARNNPISNLSDIVTIEKLNKIQKEDLSDGRILNDSQTPTTNLQTTLTKLLNISKLATIKIPNTKNIDAMADNMSKESETADGTAKPNTESTSEFSTLKNHENISNGALNTVDIKTTNETLDNSNEIKIGNIIPMSNNNETIDVLDALELDTIIKSSISNKIEPVLIETDTLQSIALENEYRFKLPSLNVTEIIIVENVIYDTLVSNCPVMITIERERSETKCSKVTITIPVVKPNTIVIENKSNTSLSNPSETILINEPHVVEPQSYDTKNKKYETKCVSENVSDTTNIKKIKTLIGMPISNKNYLSLAIEDSNEADFETTKLPYYNKTKSVKTEHVLFEAVSDTPILIQSEIMTSKSNIELDNKILDKQLNDSVTIAIKDQILKEIEIKSEVMITSNDNKTEKLDGSSTIEKENPTISTKSNNIENISEHLNTSEIKTSSWIPKPNNGESLKFKNTLGTPLPNTTETIKIKNSNIPKLADLKNIKNQETYTKILKKKKKIINLIDKLMNDSLSLIEEKTNTFDQNSTPESPKSNLIKVAITEELKSVDINILSQDQKPNETKNIESIINIVKSVDNRAMLTDNSNEIKIESIIEDLTLNIGEINITPEIQMEYDIPAVPIGETIEMEPVTMTSILNDTKYQQIKELKHTEKETLHTILLKDTDSIIFEKCETVEIDVMSDISKSKCVQAISVEEREYGKIDTESETAISNDSPDILVEEKMGIEIESISFDTILNNRQNVPIEVENEIYTTENINTIISISNSIPYVSEDKMMKKEIESLSKNCISNDTQTTLDIKEIETISEETPVGYSNLIGPVKNTTEIKIDTKSENLIHNTSSEALKPNVENELNHKFIKTKKSKKIEFGTLLNCVNILTLERPITVETEKTTDTQPLEEPKDENMNTENKTTISDSTQDESERLKKMESISETKDSNNLYEKPETNTQSINLNMTFQTSDSNDITEITADDLNETHIETINEAPIINSPILLIVKEPRKVKTETLEIAEPTSTHRIKVTEKNSKISFDTTMSINSQTSTEESPKEIEIEFVTKSLLNNFNNKNIKELDTIEPKLYSEIVLSNDTEIISGKEPLQLEINTSELLVLNQNPTSLIEPPKDLQLTTKPKPPIQYNNPPIPAEIIDIEAETVLDTICELQSTLIDKSEEPEIETTSDPTLLNNDPTKSMEEPMKLKLETTSETSIKYNDYFVPRRKSIDIEKESVQKSPFNNTDSITFEESNTVETKLRTMSESYDILMSSDIETVLDKKLETKTMENIPKITDIINIPVKNIIEIKSAINVHDDPKALDPEEKTTTIPILNSSLTVPTDVLKIDTILENSITKTTAYPIVEKNQIGLKTVSITTTETVENQKDIKEESIRETEIQDTNEEIKTITESLISNDIIAVSIDVSKEYKIKNTSETPVLNESITILTDNSMGREIKSTTTVLNDIPTTSAEEPIIIETETAPNKSLNNDTIVTLKEPNAVEIKLLIQNPISIVSQTFPVKEIEEVEIKNASETLVQYDTYSEAAEEVVKIVKESSSAPTLNIILDDTQDVFIKNLMELKTESIIETPVSTDIFNIAVENNTKIESVASTFITNDIPAIHVEIDMNKLKSEITTISNVNNTPTRSTDLQTKKKVDTTIANSITENIRAEPLEEVNNSKIENISTITLTNNSLIESTEERKDVYLQPGIPVFNENITTLIDGPIDREIKSTDKVLNDILTTSAEEPIIIETETAPNKSLNNDTIVTLKEPNAVEIKLLIQNPISIVSQTFPVKEIEEVEIKNASETLVQYDTYSEAAEEVVKIVKESSSAPTLNIILDDTQDVFIKNLMELKTESIIETPVSTDIFNIAVENNTKIESVASTFITNDIPAIHVEIDMNKLKSEITTISNVNNTPTRSTDLQTKKKVDTTIANSITENIRAEPLEEVNNSKIENISTITLTNNSLIESTEERKDVYLQPGIPVFNENITTLIDGPIDREIKSTDKVLDDILTTSAEEPIIIETETAPNKSLNNDTIVTLKEPNAVEIKLLIQNPISIVSQTFPVKEIEEVEIDTTSKILMSNINITEPVKDAMDIEIESGYDIHLSNDTPFIKHNLESNETNIGTSSEIPILYIDNPTELILEAAEQCQTKIMHNILHDCYDSVNFVESEEIEIEDTTSKAPVLIEREIEHATSEAPQSIEVEIEDTATEFPVSIEREMKIESEYVIPVILVDKQKRLESTKNTIIPIIYDTPFESIESSKKVEICTLENNLVLNYKPSVLDEKINEIEKVIITDNLLTNNYGAENINEQYAGRINTTSELVISDKTSDVLTETSNEIEIKSISLASISNKIQNTPIKESKCKKIERTYESLNNTVFLSSISNNILNVHIEEEPNEIETEITPETFISNETSGETVNKPNRIKNKTVSKTLMNDIISFEEPNLVQTEITMTISSNSQCVSVENPNEIRIENCNNITPILNVSPAKPINEIYFEGIKTLLVDQKENYNNTKLEKSITISDTAFLDLSKAEQTDEIKTVKALYYDVLVSNNTEFVSKPSLFNVSQTNVIDNSNAINVNTTFDSSNQSETEIIEPILDENKSIAKMQISNFTDTEDITSIPEISNCNFTDTIPLEILITKDNMETVFEPVYGPNYDYTLISTKTSDDSSIGELEEKNVTVDDTIKKQIVDDNINIKNVYDEPKDVILQIANDAQTTTGIEKSDISINFSEYRETSKKFLSNDERNLEENLCDIQKLEMSMQCMQTYDENCTERKCVQLEHTEKMSMEENENNDMMDDENKTSVDDKLYTVNESDLNAILCASSLQEALTLLDTKIKFKFKHKSKKSSSKTNLAMYKSCVETCTGCSDSGEKTSKFTEAQEFFKKIEEKSKK